LDCDREGEAIAFEVITICIGANPHLKIHRAQFSAITRRDLENAFNNPIEPDHFQNDAVLARQEIDLRTGAAFTRLQTMWIKDSYPRAVLEKVVSYGSCQFPTLSFIVERYLQHVQFQNSKYWYINVVFGENRK
jgi:DNA topoisomerase-3